MVELISSSLRSGGICSSVVGSETVNVVPPGIFDDTVIVPQWFSTIFLQMASPSPVPPVRSPRLVLVEK